MGDLQNKFPSWGETGEYPADGFFYEGGDQVNEKHLDALWNGVQVHVGVLNSAIRDRVRDLHDNVVLDQGLVASAGSGTREVDVSASNDGAYVDGERTGSISAQTTSHTANGGSTTRTDVVYVDKSGTVQKSEGTTTVPNNELKIAEVDVATDDTISDIRNYARDHAHHVASEESPSGSEPGDIWHDLGSSRLKAHVTGAYRHVAVEQNTGLDFEFEGGITVNDDITAKNGETIWDESNTYIPQGRLENDSVTVAGNAVALGGSTGIGLSQLNDYDLNGGQLTDSTQGYLDLTGDGNNLRLATGQSIEDGSGTRRFNINSGSTNILNSNGTTILNANSGVDTALWAHSGTPVRIDDRDGGFVAVEYTTSSSPPGTLELTNAKLDLSPTPANLRLATGQGIEDGSGAVRQEWRSSKSFTYYSDGNVARQVEKGNRYAIETYSGTPFIIRDEEGTFDALKYITSASSPGTLKLTNSILRYDGSGFERGISMKNASASDATPYVGFSNEDAVGEGKIWGKNRNSTMELLASDGAGNSTTLT